MMSLLVPLGCEANLETTCVAGANCEDYVAVPGEENLGNCLENCDITKEGAATDGDYPCAVQAIMDDICTNCHSDPIQNGAPFPLVQYSDAFGLYGGNGGQVIYARIASAVGLEGLPEPPRDFMPLGGPPLSSDQRTALLNDWACVCAPPKPESQTCE
jgi:hypothetical protein